MILRLKYLILIAFVGLNFVAIAQNASNSKGKQGPWVAYYKDGKTIKYKGQFINDEPTGKFVYYYETGEPSMVVEHKSDGVSECKTYHLNGSLMATGNYVNKLKEGTWWYFNNEKKVMSKEVYANGLLNGMCYEYFPTAEDEKLKICRETNYVKGLAQGVWSQYYKDGKIQVKGSYLDGLNTGECIWYDTSGKGELYGYYKKGLKHGRWRSIDADGEITYVVYKQDVELTGKDAEEFLKSLHNK